MGGSLAPFCMAGSKYLFWSSRVPGKEVDKMVDFHDSKPKHVVVYR